ncbi:MAG TPA: hypothetical protein VK643_08780 [Burkholderiales bacterium]|jgi:uncharacterized membrane protein|nr:hypothetical protein [Burkholderiales bacterium]
MHRWAPRGALAVLLLLAYPVLTHAAVTTGLAYLAWTAWLCIAALVVLSLPGPWGLAGFALLAAAPLVADADALLKFPPVIINLALAAWFGRTLAPGEEPMISWFGRLVRGTELAPDLARYTRWSTVVWTAFFVSMAAVAAVLAVWATPQIWSLFANGIDYLLVGVLFVGEYVFRRVRYRHHEHRPLADVVRTVARAGKLSPRRTARK